MPALKVPKSLPRHPHPLVTMLRDQMSTARDDYDGFFHGPRDLITLRVGAATLIRVYCILHAVFSAIEARGHRALFEDGRHRGRGLHLLVEGERMLFSFKEKGRVIPETPEAQRERAVPNTYLLSRRRRLEPTGVVEFEIQGEYTGALRFADTPQAPLEAGLTQLPEQIETLATLIKAARARQRETEVAAAERARMEHEERRKAEDLARRITEWRKASEIRAFVADVRALFSAAGVPMRPGENVDELIGWAERYADRIDPLRELRASLRASHDSERDPSV